MIPLTANAQEYRAAPVTGGWQYLSEVDHPYAPDECRVLDVADESFHAGSSYWFPVEGDGMERVYSYRCWL